MNLDDLKAERRWVGYKSPTDKAPMNPHTGRNASSTDSATWATYAEATAAQKRYRWHGVGFVLNGDGIVGIDLDDCLKPIGNDEYKSSSLARYVMDMAPSYTEVSPSGTGLHIIGTGTLERSIKDAINGDAIEVYGNGRYLTYTDEWVNTSPKEINDIQHVINEIVDLVESEREKRMNKPAPVARESVSDEHLQTVYDTWLDRVRGIMHSAVVGNRHNSRLKASRLMGGALAALRKEGVPVMTDDQAVEFIYDLLIPDQGDQRIERIAIEHGLAFGLSDPLTIWPPKSEPFVDVPYVPKTAQDTPTRKDPSAHYHLTDIGNALRLVDTCAGRLCYASEWKQWLVWDGQRWCKGDDAGVMKLAHKVALGIYDGISSEDDEKKRNALLKWAVQSESAVRIDAMIKSARPYLTVASVQFDTRPDLLCVRNGVVNLRTGQLMPHDATMMLTKRTHIDYDPSATAPKWRAFLDRIFEGNGDVLQFIQRAVGYTLTGSTDEHCLFFLYGVGANGKSTFLEAMRMVMGEYYVTTSVEAMLATEYTGGATPYVASLPGMRMAMASEMPEGRRFNESLIKDITGGGTITARRLYGDPFEFQPSHTMWISGNYRPRITGTDEGIWRRLKVVPFNAFIPPEERRPMGEVLDEFRSELSGILTWAVQGSIAWYDWGLPASRTIEQATMEYRGEEDVVARFVAAECVLQPDAMTAKHKVFEAWQRWTDEESEKSANGWSQRRFTEQLKRKGVELGGMGRMFYVGIGLRTDRAEGA
jgi:putative DNA primase/helicase